MENEEKKHEFSNFCSSHTIISNDVNRPDARVVGIDCCRSCANVSIDGIELVFDIFTVKLSFPARNKRKRRSIFGPLTINSVQLGAVQCSISEGNVAMEKKTQTECSHMHRAKIKGTKSGTSGMKEHGISLASDNGKRVAANVESIDCGTKSYRMFAKRKKFSERTNNNKKFEREKARAREIDG